MNDKTNAVATKNRIEQFVNHIVLLGENMCWDELERELNADEIDKTADLEYTKYVPAGGYSLTQMSREMCLTSGLDIINMPQDTEFNGFAQIRTVEEFFDNIDIVPAADRDGYSVPGNEIHWFSDVLYPYLTLTMSDGKIQFVSVPVRISWDFNLWVNDSYGITIYHAQHS